VTTNGEFMRVILMFAIVLMISVFLGVKYPAAGHSANGKHFGISQQKAGDLPLGERHSRPKLSLESALRIAQTFLQKPSCDLFSFGRPQKMFELVWT
jgi:hypothetical protein